MRNRPGDVPARSTGHERVCARGRRRLPHLFHLCARTGSPLGHVRVARPCTYGPQRDGHVVAPPRRVRYTLSPQASSTGSGGYGMFSMICNSDRKLASSSYSEGKPTTSTGTMNCCKVQRDRRPQHWWGGSTSGFMGAGTLLVLLPKCPMCTAAN